MMRPSRRNHPPPPAGHNGNKFSMLAATLVTLVLAAGMLFYIRVMDPAEPVVHLNHKYKHAFRVFAPIGGASSKVILTEPALDNVSFQLFTRSDQRDFLSQYGRYCQKSFIKPSDPKYRDNVILQRYNELPEPFAVELWKYCVLYTGIGNLYWEAANLVPLVLWKELLHNDLVDQNIAIEVESPVSGANGGGVGGIGSSSSAGSASSAAFSPKGRLHHSFLRLAKPHSKVSVGVMRFLVETKSTHPLDPLQLAETVGLYVNHDKTKKRKKMAGHEWNIWTARCMNVGLEIQQTAHADSILIQSSHHHHAKHAAAGAGAGAGGQSHYNTMGATIHPCPVPNGGHCCQVWQSFNGGAQGGGAGNKDQGDWPTMVLRNPLIPTASTKQKQLVGDKDDDEDEPVMPFLWADRLPEDFTDESLGMPVKDLPFISKIREYPTGATPATRFETPNFFDILMENNCLPNDKDCFKCLKTGYNGEDGGDCHICAKQCPCYCSALCQIRPPPKRLMGEWRVTRPSARKDPSRIVPRIIHQTWFEPVTKEGYPNMSRLIESWRQAGWQYEFYDDERAGSFITTHFPPQVREAWDAIIPGAFKADLFRYCVLLIMGGVYADMDILLESNLDEIIHPTVGFMVPQDTPGMTVGHRHCLWNGLMAAAPGHPFLAKTVENVVNNVRNRFTSVDYDDMLCPDPVLAVSHTVDTLFTAGPCILGASLNDVMKLHRQHGFEPGDMDLFQSEQEQGKVVVDPVGDARFLIPGRSIILKQQKEDMGSHRFTWEEQNLIAAATDMPDYDDRPPTMEHYSKTHEKFGVYGLHKLYTDSKRANEEFQITIAA